MLEFWQKPKDTGKLRLNKSVAVRFIQKLLDL